MGNSTVKYVPWCKKLSIFRYYSPYEKDESFERLAAKINIPDVEELKRVCRLLKLRLKKTPKHPKIVGEEISGFPQYRQIGFTRLFGRKVFIWADKDSISIEINGTFGDMYAVSKWDFRKAGKLEKKLAKLDIDFVDPPIDNNHCICPKYYPEFWKKQT